MPGRKRDSSTPSRRQVHKTKHYVNASVNAPSPATTKATPTSRRDSPPRISLNSAPTRSISDGGRGTRTAPRKFMRFGENGVHGSGEPMPRNSESSSRKSPFARDSLPRRASTAFTSWRRSARRVPASRQSRRHFALAAATAACVHIDRRADVASMAWEVGSEGAVKCRFPHGRRAAPGDRGSLPPRRAASFAPYTT